MESKKETETPLSHIEPDQSRRRDILYYHFDQMPIPLAVFLGNDHTFDYVNAAHCQMLGKQPGEIIGRSMYEIYPDIEGDSVRKIHESVLRTGKPVSIHDCPISFLKNEQLCEGFYNIIFSPLIDNSGMVTGIVVSGHEVTAHIRYRNKLEESEKRLKELANAMPQVVWIAESNGAVIYYNDQVSNLDGVTRNEDGKWQWEGVVHEEDAQKTIDAWRAAVEKGVAYEIEHRIKTTDGNFRWHLSRAFPQRNDQGQIIKWFGTATDVHVQKTTNEKIEESERQYKKLANDLELKAKALQESEARFRTLAETLPLLVWMTNENGEQEYYSKRWEDYTGISPITTATWKTIIYPDDAAAVDAAWKESLATGKTYKVEVRIRNADGQYRWHYAEGEPIRNEEGKITNWIGAFSDIHDRKTMAKQLELLVSQRTMELQRSNDDLQQFAHVASHDLKEPVRKIKTFGDRLMYELGDQLPPRAKAYLEKMESSADRIFKMIEGILQYSTIEENQEYKEKVDLNKVLDDITSDLELVIKEKSASIFYNDLPSLKGSSTLIHQLFYNLLYNALKFARKEVHPVITIKATNWESNSVYITVTDNGIGFEQQHSEKIFKTFTRLNNRDKYEGTGLGLSLCKKIVERHGGHIYASGKENEGAIFNIVLPQWKDGL